jgi:predicted house-cleaning noncanonical NTP pyrophosphatase (MazG superfamily)
MMRLPHNKLVRDNIPEIIRGSGKQCEVEVMPQEEYRQALLAKLVEEAKEAQEAANAQEGAGEQLLLDLADLQEVMAAVMAAYGIDGASVQDEKERRLTERGGFTKRLKLVWTAEPHHGVGEAVLGAAPRAKRNRDAKAKTPVQSSHQTRHKKRVPTVAEDYRVAAGLTLEHAAQRARVGVAYLRRAELHGCPLVLAECLAYIYQCPIDLFLNGSRKK